MRKITFQDEMIRTITESREKDIEKLKEERRRLLSIAYNAICGWQEDSLYERTEEEWKEYASEYLGITKEEYDEIME